MKVEETLAPPALTAHAEPGYVRTGIALIDNLFDWIDRVTNGKGGVVQRLCTYLIIGGWAAVVNLSFLGLFYKVIPMPVSDSAHYYIAFAIAAEISIFANFIPNDRITFSRLPGHARSWWARCLRYHTTTIAGTLITLAISAALKLGLGMFWLWAQSIAIIIALIFNFSAHHLWTYRRVHVAE
ncbi:MAG TPA: GtrA family protein [Ktedonobacterales bacterium]|jgi:putative flippase GtrA